MINEISIKKVASFGEADGDLTKLKKINFVYGSNATGKTTISRVIDDPGSYNDCSISWVNERAMESRVYNQPRLFMGHVDKGFQPDVFVRSEPGFS